jgi:hypothetical protein
VPELRDWTYRIVALQDARHRMQEAKRAIKSEEEHKALQAARLRIAERSQEAEIAFARDLAAAVAEGMPQSVLRSDVLRTNAWDRWVYWRDLAEIEPERVTVAKAKQARVEAERPFHWDLSNPGAPTFRVSRGPNGEEIDVQISYVSTRGKFKYGDDYETPEGLDRVLFSKWVDGEVQRAFAAGEIGVVPVDEEADE